jgi:hypothetical protein
MTKYSTYLKAELLCMRDFSLADLHLGDIRYEKDKRYSAIINNEGVSFLIGTNENDESELAKEYHAEYYSKPCTVDLNQYFQILSVEQCRCAEDT